MNRRTSRAKYTPEEMLMETGTRAAALLNHYVCRFLVACRADLTFFQVEVLRSLSRSARAEALSLYTGSLRRSIEIDERDLRRAAVGLARLRILGQPDRALLLEQEVLALRRRSSL